ncbi:hypothetical protein GOV13_00895 [Candidatus Pacearchaeota archaeon]|nr:hypothetical protein [Candidatus Pacearchaeota archaeon]
MKKASKLKVVLHSIDDIFIPGGSKRKFNRSTHATEDDRNYGRSHANMKDTAKLVIYPIIIGSLISYFY